MLLVAFVSFSPQLVATYSFQMQTSALALVMVPTVWGIALAVRFYKRARREMYCQSYTRLFLKDDGAPSSPGGMGGVMVSTAGPRSGAEGIGYECDRCNVEGLGALIARLKCVKTENVSPDLHPFEASG